MKKLIIILFICLLFLNFKTEKREVIKKGTCLVNYKTGYYKSGYEYFKFVDKIRINEKVYFVTYYGIKIAETYYLITQRNWKRFKNGNQVNCELWSGNYEKDKVYKCDVTIRIMMIEDTLQIICATRAVRPRVIKDPTQFELPIIYNNDSDFSTFTIQGVELWK